MSRQRYYKLIDGEPVAVPGDDPIAWAHDRSSCDSHVADVTIGDSRISTVFLGLDYQHHMGPPLLWETMVFGGALNMEQDRCSGNRKDAQDMHDRMVERVKVGLK